MRTIGATEFKAHFLELIEEVRKTGKSILVTKRGKPAAMVVPPPAELECPFEIGRFDGTIEILGDLVAPIDTEWEAAG